MNLELLHTNTHVYTLIVAMYGSGDAQQYPSVVVSYGLKAMQYGSEAAAQQVPRMLQVLELYPETMDQFVKKVCPYNTCSVCSVQFNFDFHFAKVMDYSLFGLYIPPKIC